MWSDLFNTIAPNRISAESEHLTLSRAFAAQDACAEFLSDQLRSRDAAGWAAMQVPRIWAWAEYAARDDLARDCREFACQYFPEVARSPGANCRRFLPTFQVQQPHVRQY